MPAGLGRAQSRLDVAAGVLHGDVMNFMLPMSQADARRCEKNQRVPFQFFVLVHGFRGEPGGVRPA